MTTPLRLNRIARRTLAAILALSLVSWSTPLAYADPKTQSQNNAMVGGVISIWANDTLGLSKMAAEVLERGVIFGLGQAANVADSEHISSLFSTTQRIFAGPTAAALAEIKDLCVEIQKEINELQGNLNDSTGAINASITELSSQLSSMEYDDYHNNIASFYVTYEGLYNDFVAWSNAVVQYAEDPSDSNLAAVQAAYDKVNAYYEADSSSTTKAFNFDSDLQEFLSLISPYSSNAAVDFDILPSDASAWGQNLQTKTYFDALYDDLSYHYPFEHDMYRYMTAGMNEGANALCMYLSSYRMFVEFSAQKIDADPSLSEEEKTRKTQSLWLGYQEHAYKAYRGLEQMASEYGQDVTGYMRPYDTSITAGMIYHDSYNGYTGYGSNEEYDTSAKKTSSTMAAYQAKPVGDTSAYLIRKGSNPQITCGDLTEHALTTVIPANQAYGPTADFMNLRYVNYPNGYTCVNGYWDLADLYSSNAYTLSGSLLVSFLKSQGFTDLPRISETSSTDNSTMDDGQFLITPVTRWDSDDRSIDDVNFTQWVNVSQPLYATNPANNEVSIDGDEDIHGNSTVKNSEFMLMFYGNPVVDISTSVTGGEGSSVGVYEVKAHKQTYYASYNSNPDSDLSGETHSLASGGVLDVRVKPAEGRTIKSVTLQDMNGNILADLVGNSEFSSENSDVLTAQEILENLATDEDGNYTFRVGVPYQKAKICVEFTDEDPSLAEHDVDLAKSEQGDLQFDSRTGVPSRSFKPGDSVGLSVRPFEGWLCSGIKLYQDYGTEEQKDVTAELSLEEVTDANALYTPTTREFRFSMPSYDVTAVAEYEQGVTTHLSVLNNKGGTLAFSGIPCQNEGWLSNPVTFKPGDTVSVTTKATLDHELKKLVAYKKDDSSVVVELTKTENGATFVMPDYDVVVRAEYGLASVGDEESTDSGTDSDPNPDTGPGTEQDATEGSGSAEDNESPGKLDAAASNSQSGGESGSSLPGPAEASYARTADSATHVALLAALGTFACLAVLRKLLARR